MKYIINYLLKKILRLEFVNLRDINKLKIYLKMKDSDIIDIFKARYTDNFSGHLLAGSDEERWILKGRLLEDLDFLNSIENAENTLLEIEDYKRRQANKESILMNFQRHLVSVVKKVSNKVKKPFN